MSPGYETCVASILSCATLACDKLHMIPTYIMTDLATRPKSIPGKPVRPVIAAGLFGWCDHTKDNKPAPKLNEKQDTVDTANKTSVR